MHHSAQSRASTTRANAALTIRMIYCFGGFGDVDQVSLVGDVGISDLPL